MDEFKKSADGFTLAVTNSVQFNGKRPLPANQHLLCLDGQPTRLHVCLPHVQKSSRVGEQPRKEKQLGCSQLKQKQKSSRVGGQP